MYPRVSKVKRPDGHVDEYVQLVEAFRDDNGKPRQRLVVSLGRRDLLTPHVDALVRILGGQRDSVSVDDLDAGEHAPEWGRVLAVRHIWGALGLDRIVDRLERRPRRGQPHVGDKVLALVANRLCEPRSEHGLATWLEHTFVCNREGQRWLPAWRDDDERRRSRRPRVKVKDRQLDQWYRSLDFLYEHKVTIEHEVFLRLRQLFSLKAEMVFYDVTSTYFEGSGPEGLAYHGHSRDNKHRDRQVLVGVVMVDGWPIAHHVFEGNLRDAKTVEPVVADVQQRFGLKRMVFVGDRGMVTRANLKLLKDLNQGYLVGLNRRRSEQIYRYIQAAEAVGQWQSCPVGITAREKEPAPRTLVQEVPGEEEGVRVFVVHSDERQEYERRQREKSMGRVQEKLARLVTRVASGQLKAREKIGAAATRIMTRNHGQRYFDWELTADGKFRYFEHPVNLRREKALEGKYLIQTEEKHLSPVEAVQRYKQLMEVEAAFRSLKDVIEMRPIHHQTPERTKAHIFVAALGLLIKTAVKRRLKNANLDWSAEEALNALKTVQVVDIELSDDKTKRCVTRGSPRAQRVLKALGIDNRMPPGGDRILPPQTLM
jgi:transposase